MNVPESTPENGPSELKARDELTPPDWVPGWLLDAETRFWPPEEGTANWPLGGQGDDRLPLAGDHERVPLNVLTPQSAPELRKLVGALDLIYQYWPDRARQFWSAATSEAFLLVELDVESGSDVKGIVDARRALERGDGLTLGLVFKGRTVLQVAAVADHELEHIFDVYEQRRGRDTMSFNCTEKVAWGRTLQFLLTTRKDHPFDHTPRFVRNALDKAADYDRKCPDGPSLERLIERVETRFGYVLNPKKPK